MEVAVSGAAKNRGTLLGVLYDEVARKEWENKAGLMGASFKIADAAKAVDDDVLRRAGTLYDLLFANVPCKPFDRRRVRTPERVSFHGCARIKFCFCVYIVTSGSST